MSAAWRRFVHIYPCPVSKRCSHRVYSGLVFRLFVLSGSGLFRIFRTSPFLQKCSNLEEFMGNEHNQAQETKCLKIINETITKIGIVWNNNY